MEYYSYIQKRNWERGRAEAGSAQTYKVRRAKQSGWLCCPCHLSACYWLCRGFSISQLRGDLCHQNAFRNVFSHTVSVGSGCLCCHHLQYTRICSSGHTASSLSHCWQGPAVPGKHFHMCISEQKMISTAWKSLLHLCTWATLLRRVTSGSCTRAPTSLQRKCTAVPADRGCADPEPATHQYLPQVREVWGNSHAS